MKAINVGFLTEKWNVKNQIKEAYNPVAGLPDPASHGGPGTTDTEVPDEAIKEIFDKIELKGEYNPEDPKQLYPFIVNMFENVAKFFGDSENVRVRLMQIIEAYLLKIYKIDINEYTNILQAVKKYLISAW